MNELLISEAQIDKNMLEHRSPWLMELRSDRVPLTLRGNESADVVVVGGGIAGVSTAFELLERGNMSVTLIEADRIAHGASGNGSGQVVASFEGGSYALADRFGQDLAKAAMQQIASSNRRFGSLTAEAGCRDKVHRVKAYIGYSSIGTVEALGTISMAGQSFSRQGVDLYAAVGSGWNCQLRDRKVSSKPAPPEKILRMLGTRDGSYCAAAVTRTSIANIASICEGLVQRMANAHPERFRLYEGTKALSVHSAQPMSVQCENGRVECKRVVICTNGYAPPDLSHIRNSFPEGYLQCVTGYMNGYKPSLKGERVGLFFHQVQPSIDEPYIFTTTWGKDPENIMLMIGGPQYTCDGGKRREVDDRRAHARIDHLASEIFDISAKAEICWDGSMGYTSTGVRLAGPDPRNPNLFYNLGCNGIGILHSIYGAQRIAKVIMGKKPEDSVFDPIHQFNVA
jgi:glycine/D-amino acid oxidase-like deaminating enzyme